MRVDADDVLTQKQLISLRQKINQDESYGSVSGSWIEIDRKNKILNKMILEESYAQSAFHGACTLFRTDAVKKIRFKENKIFSQDGLYTWLKISEKWKSPTIKEFIFHYRRHEGNLSNHEDKLFLGRRRAYECFFHEKNYKSNSCVIIGYGEHNLTNDYIDESANHLQSIEMQLEYIEKCKPIKTVYISTSSKILQNLELNRFKKLKILSREESSETLISSLQKCPNVRSVLTLHDDVFLLNPNKKIWTSDFMSIALYSKICSLF